MARAVSSRPPHERLKTTNRTRRHIPGEATLSLDPHGVLATSRGIGVGQSWAS